MLDVNKQMYLWARLRLVPDRDTYLRRVSIDFCENLDSFVSLLRTAAGNAHI